MASSSKRVTPPGPDVTRPRYTVGKAELANALGWTRPKLDRRLDSDPTFPVVTRGTRAGGWEFDLEAVRAYLAGEAPPAPAAKAAAARPAPTPRAARAEPPAPPPEATPGTTAKPSAPAAHAGEGTAKQRKDNAQAAMLEDKLRLSRKELVEAEEMRTVLATMLAHLSKGVDGIPVLMLKRLGLPEDALPVLREIVDDVRSQMVLDLRKVLNG